MSTPPGGADPRGFAASLSKPLADLPHELALMPLATTASTREVVIRPPGSKSLTNRALLLGALADGETTLTGCLLDADDAKVMIDALRTLGAGIDVHEPESGENTVRVRGVAGRLKGGCEVNLKNAGTATRFLAGAACLADAPVVIDGNARMRERPIAELLELLRRVGVKTDELGAPGRVPIRVHPSRPRAGALEVGATQSSQYISALLLLAPWTEPAGEGLTLRFAAPPTSHSYIDMTLALLRATGLGEAGRDAGWREARAGGKGLRGFSYRVEADASGAAPFWGAGAVGRIPIRIDALPPDSLQGDAGFRPLPARILKGGTFDLTLMPDTAMVAAAVACFASGPVTLEGLRTLRVKETDRLAALKNELTKVGAGVEIEAYTTPGGQRDERLRVTPPTGGIGCSPNVPQVAFDTYDDHRMAMSLAIIALKRPNVVIRDPQCVAKTYPGFWKDWAGLYR